MSAQVRLKYRDHCAGGDVKRVWRDDWLGDVFEVLGPEDFAALVRVCAKFNIPLEEVENE